jgi:exonuclease SbcC
MNPQLLKIRNLRAFASADLDLSAVECAAIVGPNGAGKSTVCEAILWTLFGESRSSGVDGVVKLGEQEASVELTYAHGDNLYRLIRKRSRDKRSTLDYLVMDEEEWKPLTGASIAETQTKIERDLAMDKNLFLASSCVTQGNSAGICEAGPAERKAILMQLLQDRLARFGPLMEAAKARRKALDETLNLNRAKSRGVEEEIQTRGQWSAAKENCEQDIADLNRQLSGLEIDRTRLIEAQAAQKADREKLAEIGGQMANIKGEVADLEVKRVVQQEIIDCAGDLLRNADQIRDGCAESDDLEARLAELGDLKERHTQIRQTCLAKEADLKQEGQRLDSAVLAKLNEIGSQEAALEDCQRRAVLIAEVPCHDSPMAAECKLLANARQAAANAVTFRSRLDGLRSDLQALKSQHEGLKARFLAELESIRAQASALGYDAEAHQQIQDHFNLVKPARELLPELAGAEERAKAARSAIADLHATIEAKQTALAGLSDSHEVLRQKLGGDAVPVHACTIAIKDRLIAGVKGDLGRANTEFGACEERLSRIEWAAAEVERLTATLQADGHARLVYATLEEAFSRDGIPALVIDAAIPQIEETANEILSRLSDGRMTVRLSTQKQTQTAGIRETLDIVVSDAQGERLYEDWSGGERLRIDLAVRIALGQMLATRTGAQIETLILDEVCAPLDETGEDALIDCINRLRPSFGCILLITHREGLKDRLPSQIIVSKDGGASTVSIAA